MDEVVERVARAICIVHGTDPDSHSPERRHAVDIDGVTNIVTDHMGPLWNMWASDASAALSALRPGDRLPGGLVVVDADAYDGLRALAEYREKGGKSLEDIEAETAAAKE